MKKKLVSVILCAAMVGTMAAGCGSKEEAAADTITETTAEETTEVADNAAAEETVATGEVIAPKNGDHYKFGFTEMSAGSFFEACYNGAAEIIEANGDEIIHSEGKADSAYQLGVVEDFIAQGCDAVFYNPSDAAASAAAVKALNDAGIPIINFDSAVSDLSKVNCFVVSDSYS